MKQVTKIIIGLVSITSIGLIYFYLVSNDKNSITTEKTITNPEQDTVATALVVNGAISENIISAMGLAGEKFSKTDVEGVFSNSTNDKMLVIKEDIWNKLIQKAQTKFPEIAKDCNQKYEISELSEYKFIGLLTYFADAKDIKVSTAYKAIEIKKGKANVVLGGYICCDCDGEEAVTQQIDAVIVE